jgi:hypothetical protein
MACTGASSVLRKVVMASSFSGLIIMLIDPTYDNSVTLTNNKMTVWLSYLLSNQL